MSTESYQLERRAVAFVTLQTVTPLHVGSGLEGDIADAEVMLDANQLPTIPGSGIAGVLRSLASHHDNDEISARVDSIFGAHESHGSRLSISWAHIHNRSNQPVDALGGELDNDIVLTNAQGRILRDHVRITHRGVADSDDAGKFDEASVAAGHRFSFMLELLGVQGENDKDWRNLMDLLRSENLRFGGKTRRGFGKVKLVALRSAFFDLNTPEDFKNYCQLPTRLDELQKSPYLHDRSRETVAGNQVAVFSTTLVPRFFWMIAGGESADADDSPVLEDRVRWASSSHNEIGDIEGQLAVIPGSSLKGVLSHRVAFYDNQMRGVFIEDLKSASGLPVADNNPSVQKLFGYVKKEPRGEDKKEDKSAGIVFIDDQYLKSTPKAKLIQHVKIDRFTGGAWPGALFNESPFFTDPQHPITIEIQLDTRHIKENDEDWKLAIKALNRALHNLENGHLALGHGTGRGHGRFKLADGHRPGQWRGAKSAFLNAATEQ